MRQEAYDFGRGRFYLGFYMTNRERILQKATNIEDKLLLSRILDRASKAEEICDFVWTDFLDPHQRNVAEKALAAMRDVDYAFSGGYDDAERVVIVFNPNFMSFEDLDPGRIFKVIDVSVKGKETLSHRDYLGSLMGLGIKREKIGDILVREGSCSIITLSDIAEYIKYNLTKVGNSRVETEISEIEDLQLPERKVKEIRTTVASLRLDCITGAGYGISRTKASDLIKAEKVNVNWELETSLTRQLKAGDTISVRGKGRVVVEEIGCPTKKGRIGVLLKKFI